MRNCGNAEDCKRTRKERKINAPQRLPRQRPRALTCPLPDESSRSWHLFKKSSPQRTLDQAQSALLARLPTEIRRLIWFEVLGGHLLHIARRPKRLLAIGCPENFGPELQTGQHGCWGLMNMAYFGCRTPGIYHPRSRHPAKPANLLPLLQTCRKIYTETISMLYGDNIFDINHLDTLMYLQRSVLPQRLNQIQVLNFTWYFVYPTVGSSVPYNLATWREACDVLASFAGLQELMLHLTGSDLTPGTFGRSQQGPVLEALTRIKTAKKFDVFLHWSEDQCAAVAKEGGYPFRLAPEIEVPYTPLDRCSDGIVEL
ncbi:hypothetical protein MMC20_003542 [Loxospora ochrophaea]|nr:hypothetical protein [Loxospora ochrophaea]